MLLSRRTPCSHAAAPALPGVLAMHSMRPLPALKYELLRCPGRVPQQRGPSTSRMLRYREAPAPLRMTVPILLCALSVLCGESSYSLVITWRPRMRCITPPRPPDSTSVILLPNLWAPTVWTGDSNQSDVFRQVSQCGSAATLQCSSAAHDVFQSLFFRWHSA